jgi:4-hydroxy-4-methyl-2-oxoglutarate aldolase
MTRKRTRGVLAAALLAGLPLQAQVFMFDRDQMVRYTANNPFGRSEDGRPKVPDELLARLKELTVEDIFSVLPGKRFANQYEGNWRILHPGRKLVGRAVTVQFMPTRPDVAELAEQEAKAKGVRNTHQRVIDTLQPGDVLVADMFGKIEQGTIIGNNLATSILAATGTGLVVDGAIRDLETIFTLDMSIYFRDAHPSAIGNVMVTGVNIPIRIGNATVLPGDVVFGDREGVYFIPPQFVQEIVERGEETNIRDAWNREKLLSGKYKSTDIYPRPRDPELIKDFEEFKKKRLGK